MQIGGIGMIVKAPRKILPALMLVVSAFCAVVRGMTIPAVYGAPNVTATTRQVRAATLVFVARRLFSLLYFYLLHTPKVDVEEAKLEIWSTIVSQKGKGGEYDLVDNRKD